jgi:D-alanyl-D-alanine carboxypeptidase/D-alanyl-D-alanine-endopeptidase (penicillin-binding protein 4)
MKVLIFLLFIAVTKLFNMVHAQSELVLAKNNLIQSPEFQSAGISVLVTDLSADTRLIEHQPYLSLPPASTAKLFSTAAALEILGPDYRPKTRIYQEGYVKDSILRGNIWIRGGGDITLGSRFFNESGHEADFLKRWADSLKKRGIKSIEGHIIADGSAFGYAGIPDGWSWADMGNYYGAGPSGISVFDNCIRYSFKTGSTSGSPTKLNSCFPDVPELTFHNYIRSENVNDDNSYIYGGPFSFDRFGTGSLPLNRSNFIVRGSLPDPEYQLAYDFEKVLEKNGISVSQGAQSVRRNSIKTAEAYQLGFELLFTQHGEKLSDIIRLTNMRSINLFAEGLVCLVGYEKNGNGSTESGLKEIEKYWSNHFGMKGLFLKDGSGLSRSNGISAFHFCELLKVTNSSKFKAIFEASLPVAGKSGTLFNLCRDQVGEGRVIAKSGTMSKIKSYSGYINTKSGKRLAFAIILTNYSGTNSNAVAKIEALLNVLATQ